MTFPRAESDWLIAAPSFNLSPVAPVESALSLNGKILTVNKSSSLGSAYQKVISVKNVTIIILHSARDSQSVTNSTYP